MPINSHGGPLVRALSLAFDLMLFSSLAFLVVGFAGDEFAFLPIIFAFGGTIVQAFFLRRFRVNRRSAASAQTKNCGYCNRAISVDAKICRFCLTGADEYPASPAEVADSTDVRDLQLQKERWQAASNSDL
jgi:hypothetical protein